MFDRTVVMHMYMYCVDVNQVMVSYYSLCIINIVLVRREVKCILSCEKSSD